MKQTEILKKNHEFSHIYKRGEYHAGKHLTLYMMPAKRNNKRLGITVSSKAVGKSTRRNRVRRLIKENYRLLENEIRNQRDMVFVVRKTEKLPEFLEIRQEMKYLLAALKLLKDQGEQ